MKEEEGRWWSGDRASINKWLATDKSKVVLIVVLAALALGFIASVVVSFL